MNLITGTQSRARRPFPPGARTALSQTIAGPHEWVSYDNQRGQMMLSWVIGQAGLLWGGGPWPEAITDAIQRPLTPGSYAHTGEHDLAAALARVYQPLFGAQALAMWPCQDASTACAAAVRVARAATGKTRIALYGYHGSSDLFAHAPQWGGVPTAITDDISEFEWGDEAGLHLAARGAALIIVEVPALDDEDGLRDFLRECRETADQHRIPLVIDDTVCGFRLALGGSLERYGVLPDMVVIGKAMCATGSVAALLGRAELVGRIQADVFASNTFAGHPWACAISAATVNWLADHAAEVYGPDGHLAQIGTSLRMGLEGLGIECVGQVERFIACFPTEAERRAWCGQMMRQGVIVDRPFFATLAHDRADVQQTLKAAETVKAAGMSAEISPLEGVGR